MSMTMEDDIKRWTAKRKAALVMEIIQGKTTISEASRAFDIAPSEIEEWVDEAKRGMENALRAKPLDIKEQYERQLKEFRRRTGKSCWRYVPEKSFNPCWGKRTRNDVQAAAGFEIRGREGHHEPVVPMV